MGRNSGGVAGSGNPSSGAGVPQEALVSTKGTLGTKDTNGQHYHFTNKSGGEGMDVVVRETEVFGLKYTSVEITHKSFHGKGGTIAKKSFSHQQLTEAQIKKKLSAEVDKARKKINAEVKKRFSKQSKNLAERFDDIAASGKSNKDKRHDLVFEHNYFMKEWGVMPKSLKSKFDKLHKQFSK